MTKIVTASAGAQLQLNAYFQGSGGLTVNGQNPWLLQQIIDPPVGEWLSMAGFVIAGYYGVTGSGTLYAYPQVSLINGDGTTATFRVTNVLVTGNPGMYLDYFDGDGGTSADSGSGFSWQGTPNESNSQISAFPSQSHIPTSFIFGLNDNSNFSTIGTPTTTALGYHQQLKSQARRLEINLNLGTGTDQFIQNKGTPDNPVVYVDWSSSAGTQYMSIFNAFTQASPAVKLLPVMLGAPTWMNGGYTGDKVPPLPQYAAAWGSACAQIASAWSAGIVAMEIWNEPNYPGFWANGTNKTGTGSGGTSMADPAAYTGLLQQACTAIKGVASGVPVLNGGVGAYPYTIGEPAQLSFSDWITAMYSNGAKGYFDGLAIHTYPSDPTSGTYQDRDLTSASTIMATNSDSKPIWITETGETSWGNSDDYSSTLTVTAAQQSVLDRLIYGMLKRNPAITAVFPYSLIGLGTTSLLGTTEPSSDDDGYAWILQTKNVLGQTQYYQQPVWSNMIGEKQIEVSP